MSYDSRPGTMSIVLDVESSAVFRSERLANPHRIYVDLLQMRLSPLLDGKSFNGGDQIVKKIRFAQYRPDVARVVMDLRFDAEHSITMLADPTRVVITLKQSPAQVAVAAPASSQSLNEPGNTSPKVPSSQKTPAAGTTLPSRQRLLESPRRLSGALVFGWMDTMAQETFCERRRNPFTTLRLDFQSYLFDPGFLQFRVKPRVSSGFQDGFTGMSEGTGLSFEALFLPMRPWPLRAHYSRHRRSLLTSGLASSFTRFTARNDDSSYGLQWQYLVPRHPSFEVSFDKVSTATSPESVLAQGFETQSRTVSLNGRDIRLGWTLSGGASAQWLDNQFLASSQEGARILNNRSNIRNALVMAQRPIGNNLNILLSANRTLNQSAFDRGRFDQAFDSLTGKLEYRSTGPFQGWTQARLTRSQLESHAPFLLGEAAALVPSVEVSNRMLDSEAQYRLHPYLTVFGRSEFTQVASPRLTAAGHAGNFLNSGVGVRFFRSKNSLAVGGSYFFYTTLTRFQESSPALLLGQSFDVSLSGGDPSRLRVSAIVSASRSREDVRTLLFTTSGSERAGVTLARTIFHRWTVEVKGGLTRTRYDRPETRSQFLGRDYGLSLAGSRFFLGYSRSIGAGDSLQPLLGLTTTAPAPIGLPLFLVIGSSNSNTAVNASWNLGRQIFLRGVWRGQTQSIGSLLASRFEQQEATLNWQFRKLDLEAGYVVYRFNFGSPVYRKSVIGRVTRDFRLF